MNILVGVTAMVIGALGFWQRERISQLNRGWNKRLGEPGEMAAEVGTAKYFGVGAIFMILAGAAIVIYSLVTGLSMANSLCPWTASRNARWWP